MPRFHRTNFLRKICPAKSPRILPILNRTGFANIECSVTFDVDDQKLIGLPENPPAVPVEMVLQVKGQELRYLLNTKYRTVDPVAGEVLRPLVIAPPVFAKLANNVFVFPASKPKPISVQVTAATGPVKGELKLTLPQGWEVSPAICPDRLEGSGYGDGCHVHRETT